MAGRGNEHVVNMFLTGAGTPGPGGEKGKRNRIIEISLENIKANPGQPRRVFDEAKISELAQSILENGVLQPIGVRPVAEGYEIVFGNDAGGQPVKRGLKRYHVLY